jgi:hypothetical protein
MHWTKRIVPILLLTSCFVISFIALTSITHELTAEYEIFRKYKEWVDSPTTNGSLWLIGLLLILLLAYHLDRRLHSLEQRLYDIQLILSRQQT